MTMTGMWLVCSAAFSRRNTALLAHHFTQAGLTEAAIEWWSKAGQQSLERSALVEAIRQITRALGQITTLPATGVRSLCDAARRGRAHYSTLACQGVRGA